MEKQSKHRPRGVVAIEAALVLPILILITLAGLQYGWLFLKQQEITNVVRHGVRYATRPNVNFAQAQGKMADMLTTLGLNDHVTEITVGWVPGGAAPPDGIVGDALYAKISIDGQGVDIIRFLPSPAALTAYATMSKEGP